MFDQVAPKGMIMFIVGLFLEATLLVRPALVAAAAGRDAWVSVLVGTPVILAVALLGLWVASEFPEETICEYGPRLLGGLLGRLVVVALILFWLVRMTEATMVALRMTQIYLLPKTPIAITLVIELLVAVYLAYGGIGPAIRLAELTVPFLFLLILLTMVGALQVADISCLRPVLHQGWRPVLRGAFVNGAETQGPEVLLLLYPLLTRKKAAAGVVTVAIAARLVLMMGIMAVTLTVLTPPDTVYQLFPVISTVRSVELEAIGVERVDSIFMGVWHIAAFLPIAFRLYLITLATARLFGKRDHRPFIIPTALASAALFATLPNPVLFDRTRRMLAPFSASVFTGVPLLLALGLVLWRRRRGVPWTRR